MSDYEKKPENNLPRNERENFPKKEEKENTGATQPAEDIVEKPSETEGTKDVSSEETEGSKERNIGDSLIDEADATSIRESQRDHSAEAEMHENEEKSTSPENAPNKPETSSEKSEETRKSSESKPAVDEEDMGHAYVDEAKAAEKRATERAISPEAEIDDEDDEDTPKADATSKPKDAQSELEDSVAEESEDESAGERHGIARKDYHSMSKEQLVDELEKLVKNEKVQAIKEHVEEIRAEFNAKFDEEVEQKKEDFLADGGNIIDFHYSTPLKKQFNSVYFDYKEKRNKYYQQLKQDLNKNLEKRVEIIEELKGLIDVEENINTTYNHFKELQERWRTAGAIPRDKYNTVWNTYHHHVENFYDFLHLNREFRDLDFKHNLEQKLKIISRAEELTQEKDTNRAFRELQMLHKMWKEDLGPVEREYREDIWQKFSDATKKIHDQRQEYFAQQEKEYEKNLEKKEEIIEKIREIAETKYSSHKQWQQKIKEVEALREEFFNAGKVPRAVNDKTWKKFKEVVRNFNRNKNGFYKDQKKEQYENLEKKLELVQIAEDNKDSEDFKATTALMKKIQSDWKKIGHVPRKDSDKIWKKFKNACNHYFDRLHASRNEENKEETEAFDKKKQLLDSLKSMEFSGDRKKDLPVIKNYIEEWKNHGKVPHSKRYIEGKFNKALDQAFEKLDIDKTQTELLKYENKVQALEDADDDRKINNEHYFLTKKVEETKAEIRQLENNLQFFSNVDDDNPLVKEVHENIRKHKEQLEIWKEKLQKIKSLY
ncbi:hypothetical protein GCM10007103_26480 [Salinimicrobium marinum]|uniref:DUF349 domain-containing protein n=1 Tax=Salinimicrobium marinum TaxID=680283 RepID=A0A918W0T1_9FLAO|nr:DUF349 domain-containing protein [Salinimicrobium marinum]GHA43961.1 hypothetical protein GCM10007103_26480 [Salinimicrobium marinum]